MLSSLAITSKFFSEFCVPEIIKAGLLFAELVENKKKDSPRKFYRKVDWLAIFATARLL